jgi:hypothetical protein
MNSFEQCESSRKSKEEYIEKKELEFTDLHAKLVACRVGDPPHKDGQNKVCEEAKECEIVRDAMKEKKTTECDECDSCLDKFPKFVKDCDGQCSNGYVPQITWAQQELKTLTETCTKECNECKEATEAWEVKVDVCKKIRDACTNIGRHCTSEQSNLELGSCFRLDKTLEMNKAYSKCYNPVLSNYQQTVVILQKSQKDRNHEWSAVARIKCFLKIFTLTTNKEKTDQIDTCRHGEFTTTKYDLVYRPAYVKQAQKKIEPFACTDEYEAKYYTNRFDPKWAPVTKCKWCSGFKPTPPPTPEPTPEPTPFPTPPPTKKPTPVPTKARGQDCRIYLYTNNDLTRKKGGKKILIKYRNKKWQKAIKKTITNRGIGSFKALGMQCKFCFYSESNYLGKLLGSRIPPRTTNSGWIKRGLEVKEPGVLKKTKSIRIIDSRFITKCPVPGEKQKEKVVSGSSPSEGER